ncbi:hypothetical protein C7H84_25515 [Burkholderia sp. Nafp2/4-1b]|uniref:hypothetical protein n=1 Tax=Burkholderia sp. Nafp2/4-1b TaxID=2116686 RepID=UPI000EF85DB7|nr:hypothetical protein [Burkholderia sp. Nafp2/4-1b]RKU00463.1 hypothetical protein C7H84_25515 [Burkholderia sp. Nafp2/4-1b]
MNISKRGDHLFAAGLWKTIGDVAKSVRTQIGEYSEGRVLADALFALQRELGGSEFDVTINQGRPVAGSDPHSLIFGRAVERFKYDMEAVVFALKHRRGIDGPNGAQRAEALAQANTHLATAKQYAIFTVGRFFDAVVDRDVLEQIVGAESPARGRPLAARKGIDETQRTLTGVRQRIIGALAQM